jgi:rhomboid protease GluP
MAVNIGLFLVTVVLGSAGRMFLGGRTATLVDLGALQPLLIARDGQYWRLVTAIFLHAGLFHLLFNMWALYLFGNLIERALGSLRFLAIYLVSGFLASVASFLFSNPLAVGVGASGAIFGLLGAWVAYNLRRRGTAMASANLRTAAVIIAINVIFGLSVAGIDNFAHLGGLAAGVVLGWLAEGAGPRSVRPLVQAAGFAAVILVGVVLTVARAGALAA